jgi:probable phosphoglycerate mutase
MSTTTLYLVRHGAAAHDDESADPGLSPLGELQAAAVSRRLSEMDLDPSPDAVLHSSRRRAAATAAVIAASHLAWPCRQSDDLEDRTPIPSDWSALSLRAQDFLRAVPTDERDEAGHRLDQALTTLLAPTSAERTVVAITHAFVIAWFVRAVLEAPELRWMDLPVANGSLTIIRHAADRPRQLIAFNDTGHLP